MPRNRVAAWGSEVWPEDTDDDNAVSTRAGAHGFSVKGLRVGAHTIKVVALVRSPVPTDASGKARTTSLTVKLPFTVC
jgi:hypothetical protein